MHATTPNMECITRDKEFIVDTDRAPLLKRRGLEKRDSWIGPDSGLMPSWLARSPLDGATRHRVICARTEMGTGAKGGAEPLIENVSNWTTDMNSSHAAESGRRKSLLIHLIILAVNGLLADHVYA
ncbi:MAG: hypothetical protein ACI835_001377 [Planctomycetota bacterium]|jgi:hypothetical protein